MSAHQSELSRPDLAGPGSQSSRLPQPPVSSPLCPHRQRRRRCRPLQRTGGGGGAPGRSHIWPGVTSPQAGSDDTVSAQTTPTAGGGGGGARRVVRRPAPAPTAVRPGPSGQWRTETAPVFKDPARPEGAPRFLRTAGCRVSPVASGAVDRGHRSRRGRIGIDASYGNRREPAPIRAAVKRDRGGSAVCGGGGGRAASRGAAFF